MNSPAPRLLSAAFALLAPFASLHAGDYTWNLTGGGVWDTTTANWSGAGSTWVNSTGNNATFGSLTGTTTVSFGENITVGTLSTTGGNTVNFTGGAGTTIDVTNISTAGAGNGSIDMSKVLTGNHDLNFSSTATSGGGRLNLKTAANYTGDTFLTGSAYLLSDGVNNALTSTTTLNLAAGTTFRLAKAGGNSQELAGLISTTTGAGTVSAQTTNAVSPTNFTVTINTKSGATTTYSGTLSNSGTNILLNLAVTGLGTQALNGTNSYGGTTTVSGGTLSLGSNLSASSAVFVSGGALTSSVANVNLGTGAVSMSSGEISARGNAAAGTFTVAANQNFTTTGGKLTFNIGTASDQIKGSGTGAFSIGSGTELALILGSGFSYASTYQLFGSFAGGSVAGTGVSITGYDTANWLASLSNAGVLSFSAAAVPEPSTYAALAGAAMLGCAAIRRRRSR